LYVVISGNTGSGKSTFGKALIKSLDKAKAFKYVDERTLHHELLQQMFDRPKSYAFLSQMNFLVQRTLKIKYLTDNNQSFVMERSLEEDFLFAYRYYELGHISKTEFEIYNSFWKYCTSNVPSPILYVYLCSDNIQVLVQRVIDRGGRELADTALYEYVSHMNRLYEDWFDKLTTQKLRIPVLAGIKQNEDEMRRICQIICNSHHFT
jgi:deoxyadenosine/deoxycytidine kinase